MDCPACKREMQEILSEGTPIDFCTRCRGTFLDRDEHAPFAGHPEAFRKAVESGLRESRPASFACPRCGGRMRTGWALARDFHLERCDGCGGLWFDSRELSRLKKLEPEPQPVGPASVPTTRSKAAGAIPASPLREETTVPGRSPSAFHGEGPLCPHCGEAPRDDDRWQCRCSFRWQAIAAKGVCPKCRRTWEELQCLRCAKWASPRAWYRE